MVNTLILCNCLNSQPIDAETIGDATGLHCSKIYSALCGDQIGDAATLLQAGDVLVACQQERQTFEELAEELEVPSPGFVDLRDRAGWSDEGQDAAAKMAALVAESQLPPPITKMLNVTSQGQCLILGPQDMALEAAAQLRDILNVTVLLGTPNDVPFDRSFDIVSGTLRRASGALGEFEVRIDGFQTTIAGGRGTAKFTPPRDGATSTCDLILDLRGQAPLFSHKRDGYIRVDPGDPKAVASAVFEVAQLVGEFEKPFYVAYDPHICAHTRSGISGCSNCIEACQSGAITTNGEQVKIDPNICTGCGDCSAVCPSGAVSYDAPTFGFLLQRLNILAKTFRDAGGKAPPLKAPRLLVHDSGFGGEMIALSARYGQGLPADVVPLEVESLPGFGHAEMLAALGTGFAAVDILLAPNTERATLDSQLELALAISDNGALRLLDVADPDALSEALFGQGPAAFVAPVLPIGNRRQVTRLAAKALRGQLETPIPLPKGAPYGAVVVDQDACTLCLSCVSLCPSGALLDNEDKPQLRFQEDACLQCGICTQGCPEKAISLVPRLDISDKALDQTILNEEDPFACITCGGLFGVKSAIDRVMDQLAGKHPMFADSDSGKLIQMCDKCRIEAQYHSDSSPFQGGARTPTRTTDDYLKRRDN